MKIPPLLKRIFSALSLLVVTLLVYVLWARPAQLRWGATVEEINRLMPGDELDPTPTLLATRANTIAGTPEEIWPWLLQMGYDRAEGNIEPPYVATIEFAIYTLAFLVFLAALTLTLIRPFSWSRWLAGLAAGLG